MAGDIYIVFFAPWSMFVHLGPSAAPLPNKNTLETYQQNGITWGNDQKRQKDSSSEPAGDHHLIKESIYSWDISTILPMIS